MKSNNEANDLSAPTHCSAVFIDAVKRAAKHLSGEGERYDRMRDAMQERGKCHLVTKYHNKSVSMKLLASALLTGLPATPPSDLSPDHICDDCGEFWHACYCDEKKYDWRKRHESYLKYLYVENPPKLEWDGTQWIEKQNVKVMPAARLG